MLDEAARERARVAVVTSPDEDLVANRVNAVLGSGGVTPTSVVVSGPDAARMVTVTVNATFSFITPGVYQLFHASYGNTLSMRGQSTMRYKSP